MPTSLNITDVQTNAVRVISLEGQLDGHTCSSLEKHIEQVLSQKSFRLVVDLSRLNYIASAGIGVLISGYHKTRALQGCLIVACPTANVQEIFHILGLEALFSLQRTLPAALAKAGR